MGSKMCFCKKIPLPHYQEGNGIFHFLKSVYDQIFLCNSYRQFRFGIKIRFLQHIFNMPFYRLR